MWSVAGVSSIGVACTQSAAPAPDTPVPIRTRCRPRTTAAGLAVGQPADLLDHREQAVGAVGAVDAGDEQQPRVGGRLGRVDGGLRFRVEGDRGHHAGQHDLVGQGQNGQVNGLRHWGSP